MSLPRLSMLLFASAALCSCVGTSPEQEEPKVKKSLSEYMQDNKTNSIAKCADGAVEHYSESATGHPSYRHHTGGNDQGRQRGRLLHGRS